MSGIKIDCYACTQKLEKQGALFFSTPESNGYVVKFHLCEHCGAYFWGLIMKARQDILNKQNKDYCEIGMSNCGSCGWQGEYPVSGCPNCNNSFVE